MFGSSPFKDQNKPSYLEVVVQQDFSVIEDLAKIYSSGLAHSKTAFKTPAFHSASGFASNFAHTKPVKDYIFLGENLSQLKT